MMPAMYTGVAGMSSHGKGMSAVADNIANVSTVGFKSSRTNFGDIMASSLSTGGVSSLQVGSGSHVMSIQQMMTQGAFETTDQATDLAISGTGFFAVQSEDGTEYYTRAGQFLLDKEGFIVNAKGLYLQGYNVDENGELEQVTDDLQIATFQASANATTEIDLSVNLDAEDNDIHHPSEAIVPSDSDTWNYMTTVRTYDSLGTSHDLSFYFQRESTYEGSTPSGSAHVWKVSVFENQSGTAVANPAFPDNTFYLHYDTDGLLVGSSTGQPAYSDEMTFDGTVSGLTSAVSGRAGETLTFTPTNAAGAADAAGTQVFRSNATVSFTGDVTAGNTYTATIDSDHSYTLAGGPYGSADAAAEALADAINADGQDFFAVANGADVTIWAKSNAANSLTVTEDADTAGVASVSFSTLGDLEDAVNNGRAAYGMVQCDNLDIADTVTVNGVAFTGVATAAALAAAINGSADPAIAGVVTARAEGNTVVLYADTAGTAGNALTLATDDATMEISGATFIGGMDDTATTNIQASGGTQLTLTRTDTGADAVISISNSNSLGDTVQVSFDSWTQDEYAADAESSSSNETNGEQTLSFDVSGAGATTPQSILIDFSPTGSSASTQSAGDSETYYLNQDGYTRGSLQSLNIGRDGLISGQYSNGTVQVLGAVTLTNFQAPEELRRIGDTLYEATVEAGDPTVNRPDSGGLGELQSGALEQSNVDMASEFVKMIQYQRAFQANSKIISTSDEMLAEVINLKR